MNLLRTRRVPWAWGSLAAAALLTSTGCTNSALLVRNDLPTDAGTPDVVRAQTPTAAPSAAPSAGPQATPSTTPSGGKPVGTTTDGLTVYQAPDGSYYCPPASGGAMGDPAASGYPPGGMDGPGGPRGRFGGGPGRRPRRPRHSYTFVDPGMPVYPPGTGPAQSGPGSPGAVVQYPYYTTKGPDDFFLDEDGVY